MARAQRERRLVERHGLLGAAQLRLRLRGVRDGVGDLLGVHRRVGVIGERREVQRSLSPLAGAEAVLAERELREQLAAVHAVGLDELAVGLLELAELLVDLGEAL